MKILVVGASGLIGSGVAKALSGDHEVIGASRSGDVTVDLRDPASIAAMYDKVGTVDAVISCAGHVSFKPLAELTREDYLHSIEDKVMGQVELVSQGLSRVTDGGSFTLTTGVLAREPILTGSAAALANGALESFVMGAAIEMPRGIRINCVSPTVLVEATGFHPYFPGWPQVTLAQVSSAYVKSVQGWSTGQTYKVG